MPVLKIGDRIVHRKHGWIGRIAYEQRGQWCVVWEADKIHSGWSFSLQYPDDLKRLNPLDEQTELFQTNPDLE